MKVAYNKKSGNILMGYSDTAKFNEKLEELAKKSVDNPDDDMLVLEWMEEEVVVVDADLPRMKLL